METLIEKHKINFNLMYYLFIFAVLLMLFHILHLYLRNILMCQKRVFNVKVNKL